MNKLNAMESDENREYVSHFVIISIYHYHYRVLQQLRALVSMNENLKKQEQQFKAHCKVGYCSIYLSVCLSIYLCTCIYYLFIYLFIYLSIGGEISFRRNDN